MRKTNLRRTMIGPLTMVLLTLAAVAATEAAAAKKDTLAPAAGPRHCLVENGRIVARIVLPAKPDALESYAADELQKFVKLITGRDLPIVSERQKPEDAVINWNEPPSPPGYGVWLGQTKAAESANFTLTEEKLGRDGYAAGADEKGLIVVGRCPLGTLFGVYDIIEREFGVRWFVPNEYRTTRYKGKRGESSFGSKTPSAKSFRRPTPYRWARSGGSSNLRSSTAGFARAIGRCTIA